MKTRQLPYLHTLALNAAKPLRSKSKLRRWDPTGTSSIRERFGKFIRAKFRKLRRALRKAVLTDDVFGLAKRRVEKLASNAFGGADTENVDFKFATSSEKLAEFKKYLEKQLGGTLLSDEELWQKYVEQGFAKGAGKAFQQATPDDMEPGDERTWLRSAFGRPESIEKVKLLASRSFGELEGVTSQMGQRMGRILAQGLTEGANPRDIADDLDGELGLGARRAEVIARTEIVRAHAEGQLDAFEKLGVSELGVEVEWSTAGDDRVCEECASMEGKVFAVEDAHDMIPAHPNCRCAFIPSVGPRPEADDSTENRAWTATRNAWCPTGPGGGQDNSCSPTGSGAHPDVAALQGKMAGAGVGFTKLHQEKLAALNPNGVVNGKFKIDCFTNDASKNGPKLKWFKKNLPPGTVIQHVSITKEQLAAAQAAAAAQPPTPAPAPAPALKTGTPDPASPKVGDQYKDKLGVTHTVTHYDAANETIQTDKFKGVDLHPDILKNWTPTGTGAPTVGGATKEASQLKVGDKFEHNGETHEVQATVKAGGKVMLETDKSPFVELDPGHVVSGYEKAGKATGTVSKVQPLPPGHVVTGGLAGSTKDNTHTIVSAFGYDKPTDAFKAENPWAGKLSDPSANGGPNSLLPDSTRPPVLDMRAAEHVNNYTWGYDGAMNKALRATGEPPPGPFGAAGTGTGKPDKDGPTMFKDLQDLFKNAGRIGPPPVPVHRAIQDLPKAKRENLLAAAEMAMAGGHPARMPGFASTSTTIGKFTGDVELHINAVHGLDVKPYSHFSTENELLLNHNSHFVVTKVDRNSDPPTIHMDQIHPDDVPKVKAVGLTGHKPKLNATLNAARSEAERHMTGDEEESDHWAQAFSDAVPTVDVGVATRNAFCPTGVGGGVDASCSPSSKEGVVRSFTGKAAAAAASVYVKFFARAVELGFLVEKYAGDILDTAEDYENIGKAKTSTGQFASAATGNDPFARHLGVPGVVVLGSIVPKVAAALTHYMKDRVKRNDEGDERAVAEGTVKLWEVTFDALGIQAPIPSVDDVLDYRRSAAGGSDKAHRDRASVVNRSYFADCERDEKGHCLPAGTEGYATSAEQAASVELANDKIEAVPVPTRDKVAKMRAAIAKAATDPKARAGGDARGNSTDRKVRARKLFTEFGGDEKGYVTCPWTGLKMHWTDDKKENPKGYPKFEQGKIFTGNQGGSYTMQNLLPESFAANRSRNDKAVRKENLGPLSSIKKG